MDLRRPPPTTWNEAVVRWLKESSHKATPEIDKTHVRWLDRYLRGRYLDWIARATVDRITDAKLADGVSNATVNRVPEVLRAVLRRAALDWEWIEKPPLIRLYPEPKRRVRWLTPEKARRLLGELPDHLAEMARFSPATGLRQRNVARLEWSQVDIERRAAWIHADQAKARRAIPVALNDTAVEVLKRQLGKHERFVFTFEGRPVGQVNTKAWKKALTRAGIEDFRWHDLRHTWASWLTQYGVPLNALQEMGAWQSAEMVRRYAHLGPAQFMRHAQVVDQLMSGGTSAAQNLPSPTEGPK